MSNFTWFILGALGLYSGASASVLHYGQWTRDNAPQVELDYATYVGTRLQNDVDQFLGMRYAAPPLGDLRFRGPQPPETSDEPITAGSYGELCIGTGEALGQGKSEDCLFVNVWKPADATTESKLPVWVYINGGGYNTNSNGNYNGSAVIEESGNKIVFVNFNYRVGLYGFFAGSKVQEDGDLNAGFRDQIALLHWVQDNIAQFGGDPDHVVIHGTSAGAGSVSLHLTVNQGKDEGLFVGVIAQSVFVPAQPALSELEWQYERLVEQVGCSGSDDDLACVRGQDATVLQAANVASPFPGKSSEPLPLWYWTPCIDGTLFTESSYASFSRGKFIDVPAIFGNDNDEGTYFASDTSTPEETVTFMGNNYPRLSNRTLSEMIALYPLMDPEPLHQAWFPSASKAYGDAAFVCPAITWLDDFEAHCNSNSWSYRVDIYDEQNAAQGLGVPHTMETPAIFGPDMVNGSQDSSFYTYNAPLVPVIMDYWISFVVDLSPNTLRNDDSIEWEAWDSEAHAQSRILFKLDDLQIETVSSHQRDACRFWADANKRG